LVKDRPLASTPSTTRHRLPLRDHRLHLRDRPHWHINLMPLVLGLAVALHRLIPAVEIANARLLPPGIPLPLFQPPNGLSLGAVAALTALSDGTDVRGRFRQF
jgi:hypothetical protein